MTLNDNDLAMLREMARGLDGAGVENFINNVRRRLDELEAGGTQVTRNHIRSAA
jgi:hypothetical protein